MLENYSLSVDNKKMVLELFNYKILISYETIVAFIDPYGDRYVCSNYGGSATTKRHVGSFFGHSFKEVQEKVEKGEIQYKELLKI